MTSIDPSQQDARGVLRLLQNRGAGLSCYVISASAGLDGVSGVLADVLEVVIGYHPGTIVSCITGRLAYFEGEGRAERYILHR